MSEQFEQKIAALEQRIADLEVRSLDDDEAFRNFAERINRISQEVGKESSEALQAIRKQVDDGLHGLIDDLYRNFSVKVASQAAAQVTSDTIADSLTRKVLVTRPANREELKSGEAVAIRHARQDELRK